MLDKLREKVAIGQRYKGVKGKGIGVGNCTKGFEKKVLKKMCRGVPLRLEI
jgi:hypothetical protein